MWDEAQHAAGGDRIVEMRSGWKLRCHPAAYDFAYSVQQTDPEQVRELDDFIAACRPGMLLYDIGCHFGLFSLAALHYGGPTARAIAADPSPTACRILSIESRLNEVDGRLSILKACVSDDTDCKRMVPVGVLSAGYFVRPNKDHPLTESIPTRSVTLDSLRDETGSAATHIKIDVEGDEAAVLRGAERVLSSDPRPVLFLELHNQLIRKHDGDPAETLALLAKFGYSEITEAGVHLSPKEILGRPLIRVIARRKG
jgi:FkbM family methyltransferase